MYKDSYKHRKRYYITLFTSIYVIIFTICAIVIGSNWKYVKLLFQPQEKEITIEQHQFNQLFNKVKGLEELSKSFDKENYQLRTAVYIRSAQYNDDRWDALDMGTLDGFGEYVLHNQGTSKISSLKTLGANYCFIVPNTNRSVDFYHLYATLNGMFMEDEQVADLTGWGGDLCQLAAAYSTSTLTGKNLLNAIRESMNSNGVFGVSDRNADMDAVNIYFMLKNNKFTFNSLYLSSIVYYATVDSDGQIEGFKEYLGVENCSQTEIENILYERLRENSYIQMLADNYGFDYPDIGENEEETRNAEIYRTCVKAFVETLKV